VIGSRSEHGFALPAVILLMVLLSALAVFGIVLATNQQSMSARTRARASAFYAAEGGLANAIENWAGARAALTPPGSTRVVSSGSLPGGTTYQAEVLRLDDGSTVYPLFALRSRGQARNGYTDEVGLLTTSVPFDIPINFALRVRGNTKIHGTFDVSGHDHVPPGLSTECPSPETSRPGILVDDLSHIDEKGNPGIEGDPPTQVDPDTAEAQFFDFGGLTYEQVAAKANHKLPDGTLFSGSQPAPSLTAGGACNLNDIANWGDPLNLGQPCSDWFPIIHVSGNLKLTSNGAGQGILLVDGDLEMTGGAEFYGPVIVRGRLKSTGGGFHVYGGVIAGATDLDDLNSLGGSSAIGFSTCALRRAVSHSDVAEPRALVERPWYQRR